MLVIRSQQVAAFAAHALRAFEERMVQRQRERVEWSDEIPDEATLRRLVAHLVAKARDHGIVSGDEIEELIDWHLDHRLEATGCEERSGSADQPELPTESAGESVKRGTAPKGEVRS